MRMVRPEQLKTALDNNNKHQQKRRGGPAYQDHGLWRVVAGAPWHSTAIMRRDKHGAPSGVGELRVVAERT